METSKKEEETAPSAEYNETSVEQKSEHQDLLNKLLNLEERLEQQDVALLTQQQRAIELVQQQRAKELEHRQRSFELPTASNLNNEIVKLALTAVLSGLLAGFAAYISVQSKMSAMEVRIEVLTEELKDASKELRTSKEAIVAFRQDVDWLRRLRDEDRSSSANRDSIIRPPN